MFSRATARLFPKSREAPLWIYGRILVIAKLPMSTSTNCSCPYRLSFASLIKMMSSGLKPRIRVSRSHGVSLSAQRHIPYSQTEQDGWRVHVVASAQPRIKSSKNCIVRAWRRNVPNYNSYCAFVGSDCGSKPSRSGPQLPNHTLLLETCQHYQRAQPPSKWP